jgi:hypothetical protein
VHTWHFYGFSGTNLLKRCHSASSQFSAIFDFRKIVQKIFSELDKTKVEVPILLKRRRSPEGVKEVAQGSQTTPWRGQTLARAKA